MKILVTGANGFVGRHLVDYLKEGHTIYASGRALTPPDNLDTLYLNMDITDPSSIKKALKYSTPDVVFHLAAQSTVRLAWEDPVSTVDVNITGTINLLKALRDMMLRTRLITIGSSEEYGLIGKLGEPLTEKHPCLPQNPYAISKFAMGQMVLQLSQKYEMEVIHVRPFNHFGPGQQMGYVVSDFASQIAEIEQKIKPPVLRVGNLNAKRDFTDVTDVVRAYALLMEKSPAAGIYNVCSGIARSAQDILEILINQAKVSIEVVQDASKLRPSEVPLFIGSNAKIYQATTWRPKLEFENSIIKTLNWWRDKVKINAGR